MRLIPICLAVAALLACGEPAATPSDKPITVEAIRTRPEAYAKQVVALRAYVISTRHGMLISDAPRSGKSIQLDVDASAANVSMVQKVLDAAAERRRGASFYVLATIEGRLERRQSPPGWIFILTNVKTYKKVLEDPQK